MERVEFYAVLSITYNKFSTELRPTSVPCVRFKSQVLTGGLLESFKFNFHSIVVNAMRNILFALCLLSGSVAPAFAGAPVVGKDSGSHRPVQHQAPLLPQSGPAMPAVSNDDHNISVDALGDVVISDVIGRSRSTNIFAGLTRGVDGVAERFGDSNANTTALAPLNSAITALPRKPWEDPTDYVTMGGGAYEGQAGVDRAAINLQRFVEAHIVPVSPWKEGEKVRTLGGDMLWWAKKDDGTIVVRLG